LEVGCATFAGFHSVMDAIKDGGIEGRVCKNTMAKGPSSLKVFFRGLARTQAR
jgi:hypothetical protein